MKYTFEKDRLIIDSQGKFSDIRSFFDTYLQSKKNRYLLLQKQLVLLDDIPVRSEDEPVNDRKIILILPEEEVDHIPAETPCRVIYEDPFLYLAHKDPGYIIHGEPDDITCLNARAAKYQLDHHIQSPVRPIHRLDKDTSGLVLYVKIPFFQPWFDEQLRQKKITRHYMAACFGRKNVSGKFDCHEPIGKDRHVNGKYRISPTGREALTHFEVLAAKGPYLLIGCTLETGRTHQIRVHLSSMNLPIVNDPIYGRDTTDFNEMGLWADAVTFRNPLTNKKHRIHDDTDPMYEFFRKR